MRPFLSSLVLVALVACGSSAPDRERLTVATSIYPIEFLAREIAGPRAEVVNVTPPGAEPHDIELAAEQVIDLVGADVVVYLGRGFQPAVEEAVGEAEGVTVDALEHVGPLLEGDQAEIDAHFWLDPSRLAALAEVTAGALAEADPDRAQEYRGAGDDLVTRLEGLDADYGSGLRNCPAHEIVVSHEAFAYLSRYDIVQSGIAGLDPENEPSPQRLADVADLVRQHDVTTIFFERLLPPDAAETIAKETGVETAVLDPIESEPERGDYFTAMEDNLENLRRALGCAADG